MPTPLTPPTRADACTRKARTPKAAALPFPDLPTYADGLAEFWLAAWARDLAAHDALAAHSESSTVRKVRTKNKPLSLALTCACDSAAREIRVSVKELKDAGGLLFAVVGTTKLQQVAA